MRLVTIIIRVCRLVNKKKAFEMKNIEFTGQLQLRCISYLFFGFSIGLSPLIYSSKVYAIDSAAQAAAKKKAPVAMKRNAVSARDSLGITRNSVALPRSERLQTPKVVPRNMQVVKPPRNAEFYEGSTKEVEYEKLLDKEISDLFKFSSTFFAVVPLQSCTYSSSSFTL